MVKDLRLASTCDRGMLTPQPAKWVDDVQQTIEALSKEKWDELYLGIGENIEELAIFLRDHIDLCPPKVIVTNSVDPILSARIGVWLPGKVQMVYW